MTMTAQSLTPIFELTPIREDDYNFLVVTDIKVSNIINGISRNDKPYTMFSVEATFKYPLKDEFGNPIMKEGKEGKMYTQDVWVTIKQSHFKRTGRDREQERQFQAEFQAKWERFEIYDGMAVATLSFQECKEVSREYNGKIYRTVEVTSELHIFADTPDRLQELYEQKRARDEEKARLALEHSEEGLGEDASGDEPF